MASQFIRLTGYGTEPGRAREKHESARHIIAEAWRVPGSTPHIRRPSPANLLRGDPLASLEGKLRHLEQSGRDQRGGALRRDGIVLYAIVASYPAPWRDQLTEEDRRAYQAWRDRTVEWLGDCFGYRLEAVLEHLDEKFPHIHAFVLPGLDCRNRIDHSGHPGYAARMIAAKTGADHKQRERAFREGMRLWQDDYHRKVSRHFGHDRIGPSRRRFRRDTALVRRSLDEVLSCAGAITSKVLHLLDNHAVDLPGIAVDIDTLRKLDAALNEARESLAFGRSEALPDLDAALEGLRRQGRGHPPSTPAPSRALEPGDIASGAVGDEWGSEDDIRPEDLEGPYKRYDNQNYGDEEGVEIEEMGPDLEEIWDAEEDMDPEVPDAKSGL